MSASVKSSRRSIAGKTAQKPSQYLHALQMTIRRSPSAIRSAADGTSSLLSGNPSENRTDGHSEPGEITLAQNIAGHDFTGSENVAVRSKTLNFGSLVHLHAEIRERNSRAQRIAVKRRLVDAL